MIGRVEAPQQLTNESKRARIPSIRAYLGHTQRPPLVLSPGLERVADVSKLDRGREQQLCVCEAARRGGGAGRSGFASRVGGACAHGERAVADGLELRLGRSGEGRSESVRWKAMEGIWKAMEGDGRGWKATEGDGKATWLMMSKCMLRSVARIILQTSLRNSPKRSVEKETTKLYLPRGTEARGTSEGGVEVSRGATGPLRSRERGRGSTHLVCTSRSKAEAQWKFSRQERSL